MKTSVKTALAFLAVAGLAGSAAIAAERRGEHGGQHRFENLDADSSGDVTFEEFSKAADARFANADTDGDGKMTVAEIAAEIERQRAERRAKRLVDRFDIDGDGQLTMDEIESRQRKMFALMDRNDDGKVVREELPRHGHGRHGYSRHGGRHGQHMRQGGEE